MAIHYPAPQELGFRIPAHLRPERFSQGFIHALKGGQLNQVAYFKLSFREGYRLGKLYLRQLRREQGVIGFPMKAQFHMRAYQ